MDRNIKISILLPIKDYDLQSFKRCLNSIITQRYQNYEVIIKANCIKNDFEILKKSCKVDERFIFLNQQDNSVTEAANQAFLISSGDLVTLFAHDDHYLPFSFESLIVNLDESKWYFGRINYYVNNVIHNTYYTPNPDINLMKYNNLIPQPACFWRRELFNEIGPFDESFKLCWDYDYWVRIMKRYKPKYINFVFANYFLNSNSISNKYPELMEQEKKMILLKHFS
jgi:glycosyltransferase involved in cell wall biosynthesis